MIVVTVTDESGAAQELSFEKDSVMIGRAAGNDIARELPGLSRYHARIAFEGEGLIVEDLGSTNGTFVNGARITQHPMAESDAITIGTLIIHARHEHESEAAEPEPAPPAAPEVSSRDPEPAAAAPEPVEHGTALSQSTPLAPAEEHIEPESSAESPVPPEEHAETPPHPAGSTTGSLTGAQTSGIAKGEDFYWQSLKSFLAPVWDYVMDDSVTEILINGPAEIYFEQKGRLQRSDVRYNNDQLKAAVLNIAQYVGRRVSEEEPYLDARLPDGSRVAVLMPPCSRKGISISIRKFAKEKLTLDKLLEFGSLSPDMVEYIRAAVLLKKNLIVSGGTSSGKTSLLNVVSGLIPDDERILTIEDSAELQLRQDHVVPMETRPPDKKGRGQVTIRDLVRASLRMRPDRIVVGEIRGGEALDLLQAMNTGHSGSMATVHASSARQALTRMETLALFSGIEIPMKALREQVSSALEVIIQASRLPDHSRKVVSLSEVNRLSDSGEYQVTEIFRFARTSGIENGKIAGQHIWTGAVSGMVEEMELAGLTSMVNFFRNGTAAKP